MGLEISFQTKFKNWLELKIRFYWICGGGGHRLIQKEAICMCCELCVCWLVQTDIREGFSLKQTSHREKEWLWKPWTPSEYLMDHIREPLYDRKLSSSSDLYMTRVRSPSASKCWSPVTNYSSFQPKLHFPDRYLNKSRLTIFWFVNIAMPRHVENLLSALDFPLLTLNSESFWARTNCQHWFLYFE
jgi:hypothetical protein